MVKFNLSAMLIALCTTSILTLSACSTSTQQQTTSDKPSATVKTKKIDLSLYQDQRDLCQKITEKKVIDCQKQGGSLQKQGMAQCYTCTIEYADAGKVCSDASDCLGACLNYGNFSPADKPNQQGQCAKTDSPFGCYQVIEKGVAKHAMCVD